VVVGSGDLLVGAAGVDDDQGWVGIAMSELLGLPLVNGARSTTIAGTTARVQRDIEGGKEMVEVTLPAIITSSQATEPRYPTLKGIMGAKSKPLEELTLADLELSAADVAPTQRVGAIEPAPQKGSGEVVQGDAAAGRVADLLAEAKVI